MSLKVKSNGAIRLPIYDFLLVSNSNYMTNSHHLGVIATRKKVSYLLSLGPNPPPPHPLYFGAIIFQIEWFPPWVTGKASTKNELDWFNIF